MHKPQTPPISVEQFAAYLDDNLPEAQMREIDLLIESDTAMGELAEISDIVDECTNLYLQDEFAYEADMTMLDEQSFEIPEIEFAPAADTDAENIKKDDDTEIETVDVEKTEDTFLHPGFETEELDIVFVAENKEFEETHYEITDNNGQPDEDPMFTPEDIF